MNIELNDEMNNNAIAVNHIIFANLLETNLINSFRMVKHHRTFSSLFPDLRRIKIKMKKKTEARKK